ncbi:HNH endonuclease [Morganella psychrotolerans]|uniref:HNH endonuclease n=1 Tax=Morganella psychrotolerans TaxID=368603 RepID=A0A5M9R9L5_9GAMM|nr:HNH endonuclease signature motif containing protein [Morganella psychrotolerans]KAA8716716.1 HNH endonuclease [Morganella psychrotolerans]
MKKNSNDVPSNNFSCIHELGLTGEILSISTTDKKRGDLKLNDDYGPGKSGMWVIAENKKFDHVVLRIKEPNSTYYKVYTGRFLKLSSGENQKKKIVHFDQTTLVGISDTIPRKFNGGKFSGQGKTYVSIPISAEPIIDSSQNSEHPKSYRDGSKTTITTRPDQSKFSAAVRDNCKNRCVITGATMQCRTEAAHLIEHHKEGEPDKTNGLLLRRDIHALFDQGHCAINPTDMVVHFSSESLQNDKDLEKFNLTKIGPEKLKKQINKNNLLDRWKDFSKKYRKGQ